MDKKLRVVTIAEANGLQSKSIRDVLFAQESY